MGKIGVKSDSARRVIVVTGGAGFVGGWLCRRLLDGGARVVCVDNLLTGQQAGLTALRGHPGFTFTLQDVIAPLRIPGPVHEIYNLASAASPQKYQRDPVHTFKTNVLGTMNLLDLAREKGARFVQASTSEVYGDPTVSPQAEGYAGNVNTCGPRACYDEGKRGAETLCHDYFQQYGVAARIARIFNTYGPHMAADDGRVVPNFIIQALRGEPVTLFGTGQQTRSFCYVEDMVEGLVRLMAAPMTTCMPVNLGNPHELTMRELAAMILQKTGSRSHLVMGGLPVDDPTRRRPDISRALALLGWAPAVGLSEGLDRTIAHFRTELRVGGAAVMAQAS